MTAPEAPEARFRALAEAAPIGIFETDGCGQPRYMNPAWRRITGMSLPEAAEDGWQAMIHPDDLDDIVARWRDALCAPNTFSVRFRIVRRSEIRWVDATVAPTESHGQLTGFVGTLVDVTELTDAQRVLTEGRDRALEASRLKSEFIANISHEIRTPLNGVLGLAQILAETDLDDRQRGYLQTMRRAGDDLLQLLNDVLDVSKVEAGAMRTETVPFDLKALTRDAVSLFEQNAATRGLTLDVVIDESIPDDIAGDPTRIRQVLTNLVSNAVKFTDHGSVRVHVSHSCVTADSLVARLDVIDTGCGIPAADQAAIFEPFAQGDASTTRRFGGSGLGLAISRRIAELLGGRLTCASELGRGTTFTLMLPLARRAHSLNAVTDAEAVFASPLRILVAEDNPVNVLVLQTLLSKLGHHVEVAENGQVAVDLVEADCPDVVLMDCQMPVMDGYAATAAIRALPGEAGGVPIVALTASAMPADKQRCLDTGMDAYLPKPLRHADLVATLHQVCGKRARSVAETGRRSH